MVERLVDVEPLHAAVVVEHDEPVAVLDDVDVGRDGDGLLVGVGEVAGRAALELLDLLDGLVDLLDGDLQVARDGLVVVLLEVVQVPVDDGDLELVEAEHLGLHAQALLEVARADAQRDRTPASSRSTSGASSGSSPASRGQILDGEVGRSGAVRALDALEVEVPLLVEVADDELGEAALLVAEVAHLELPHQVVEQVRRAA